MSSSLARILPSVFTSSVSVTLTRVSSTTEPALFSAVGASFVPLTVIVISCVASPPWPSLTVTLNISSWVSPSPSDCTLSASLFSVYV